RFIGEEGPGKIFPIDIHGINIKDYLLIVCSTVGILRRDIRILHIGYRLPGAGGITDGLDDLGLLSTKARTHAIRELAFLDAIPDGILAVYLVHREFYCWRERQRVSYTSLNARVKEFLELLVVQNGRVTVHNIFTACKRFAVDSGLELSE